MNLIDKVVEVYTDPLGDDYRTTIVLKPGEKAMLAFGGKNGGEIEIRDLFGET